MSLFEEQDLFSTEDLLKANSDLVLCKLRNINQNIAIYKKEFEEHKEILTFEDIINYKNVEPQKQNHFDYFIKEYTQNSKIEFEGLFNDNKQTLKEIFSNVKSKEPYLYENILLNMNIEVVKNITNKEKTPLKNNKKNFEISL